MGGGFTVLVWVLVAFFVWGGVATVRRYQQRQAAWASGLTARARVVRAWVTVQTMNNTVRRIQWHEYDYTTHDGRAVRFKESGGPRDRGQGEEVLVYYAAHEPDKATASAPQPGKDLAGTVFVLIMLVVGAAILLSQWASLSGV
ncbi:DUF3592 domain-containing protein [Streptomyces griseosporeus]|jgi:hypothetical protein|uniref:DUF3592 domain-containing protein n=1 Tax=Streptomyces griseosporeus TaxID=1910 RepID=UPI00368641E5